MRQRPNIIVMLVSLVAAVALWLYVVTVVAPEISTRVSAIPISIDGTIALEERGLIITAQDVTTLALEISTSRVNLSKLNAETIRVNADASKIREPGEYALTCSVTFPDTVRSSDVDLLRKSADAVTVTVTRLVRQSYVIQLNWSGSVKEGYLFEAGSVVMDPAEVVVYGPEEEVNRIDHVEVRYDVSDLEETTLETLPLYFLDAEGEEIAFSELTSVNFTYAGLTLPVYRTRSLELKLEFIEGGGVTEENVRYTLDIDSIRVKGAAEVIDELPDVWVVGTVDLSLISDEETTPFPLNLPAGVTNISGETEVSAEIRLVGVSSDTVPVSDIRVVNAPVGYDTEVTNRTVQVTVRGSTTEIKQIKQNRDNGIYILVDLADYTQTGAFTVPARVVNTAHPTLSMADTVEIGVVISVIPEPTDEEQP